MNLKDTNIDQEDVNKLADNMARQLEEMEESSLKRFINKLLVWLFTNRISIRMLKRLPKEVQKEIFIRAEATSWEAEAAKIRPYYEKLLRDLLSTRSNQISEIGSIDIHSIPPLQPELMHKIVGEPKVRSFNPNSEAEAKVFYRKEVSKLNVPIVETGWGKKQEPLIIKPKKKKDGKKKKKE